MRYVGLLVILLVAPAVALAQSGTAQERTVSRGQQIIQGCLSGSSHDYRLTTHDGTVHLLIGDNSELSTHVGQYVQLAGARDNNRDASASSDEATAHGMRFFEVQNLLRSEGTCRK